MYEALGMDQIGALTLVLAQDTPTTLWRPAKGVYIGLASKLAVGSKESYSAETIGPFDGGTIGPSDGTPN